MLIRRAITARETSQHHRPCMGEEHGAAEGSAAVGRVGGTYRCTEKATVEITITGTWRKAAPSRGSRENPGAVETRLRLLLTQTWSSRRPLSDFSQSARDNSTTYRVSPRAPRNGAARQSMVPRSRSRLSFSTRSACGLTTRSQSFMVPDVGFRAARLIEIAKPEFAVVAAIPSAFGSNASFSSRRRAYGQISD